MSDNLKKIFIFLSILTMFTSCSAIEGIFNAGMAVGIFAVIAIVVVVIFIITRFNRKQ